MKGWHYGKGWCFPLDTEILTSNGWKDYYSFNKEEDMVYQHNDDSITLVKVNDVIYNEEDTVVEVNTLNQSVAYTLDHNVYSSSYPGGQRRIKWGDEIERGGIMYFKAACKHQGGEDEASKEIYALISFIVADGFLLKKNGQVNAIGIDLDKQRKVDWLIAKLDEAGVEYTYNIYQYQERIRHRFRITSESYRKYFDWYFSDGEKMLKNSLVNTSIEVRLAIIEAYIASDGWEPCHAKHIKKYQIASQISSKEKQNIDVLQSICAISGIRTVQRTRISGYGTTIYNLTLVSNKQEAAVDLRARQPEYYVTSTWCINIDNNRFFVRRKGKIQITYNCGLSYHYAIMRDGSIYKLNNHNDITWHDGRNNDTLGILVDGYFHPPHNEKPSKEQLESLDWLTTKLLNDLNLPRDRIKGHRDFGQTACPGDLFYPTVQKLSKNPLNNQNSMSEKEQAINVIKELEPTNGQTRTKRIINAINTNDWSYFAFEYSVIQKELTKTKEDINELESKLAEAPEGAVIEQLKAKQEKIDQLEQALDERIKELDRTEKDRIRVYNLLKECEDKLEECKNKEEFADNSNNSENSSTKPIWKSKKVWVAGFSVLSMVAVNQGWLSAEGAQEMANEALTILEEIGVLGIGAVGAAYVLGQSQVDKAHIEKEKK
jgi:hypothetical protein